MKTAPHAKRRMSLLAANVLLYVHKPDGNFAFRPSAMRFHRDGSTSGYQPCTGWTKLTGMSAYGPSSGDRWKF